MTFVLATLYHVYILCLGFFCLALCLSIFFNVGVADFNQEKALVGAFSVIVKTSCTFVSSSIRHGPPAPLLHLLHLLRPPGTDPGPGPGLRGRGGHQLLRPAPPPGAGLGVRVVQLPLLRPALASADMCYN